MLSNSETQTVIGNRYLLLDMIGEGGMGAVYRVLDRLNGSRVALKKVTSLARDPELSISQSIHDSDSFEFALANEFQILARLRHPHIVSVLDYGFDSDKRPYFTMDLLGQARKITDAAQDLPVNERIRMLLQLLEALAYLHHRGIIHRDLKPENVLVDEHLEVRVLDFGLALAAEYARQGEDALHGTLAYMAPEVLRGNSAQIESDLYGFGLIAYNVFGGGYPFDISNIQSLIRIILNDPPDLTRFESPIAQFLGRLLAKHPEDRYRTVDEVIDALCEVTQVPRPQETLAIRESYLQTASFVGRETETRKFREIMTSTQHGKGAVYLIAGESGVGKSRLLNELRVRALVQNVLVIRGQAIAEGSNPYQVWRGVLQWLSIVTTLGELEAQVLKDLLPDVSDIPQLNVPNAPELTGQAAQERLINVVANIFRQQPRPIMVILEDLQWAGEESIRLLKELVRVVTETHILILGSYRYEETPHLIEQIPGAEVLRLSRFSREEISELAYSILGSSDAEAQIVNFLQRETEGNAFFVVETLRAMAAETGELRKISSMSVNNPIVDGGVMMVLQQRLERIPEENRSLLYFAAIIGRDIDLPLLAHLAPEIDLQKWLASCSDFAVLEARENQWYFSHDKMREYLIADLQKSDETVRQLHQQVAGAIEATYGERDSYIPALAHHWSKAQVAPKATYYLEKAALQAIVGAPNTVIGYIEKAIEFESSGDTLSPMQHARRHSLLGNAYYAMGDYKLAEVHLQAASRYLGAAVTPQKSWQALLGILRQVGLQFLHRRAPLRYLAKRDSAEVDRSIYAALFNKQVVYSYQGDMVKVLHAALAALNTVETLQPSEVANPAMAYGALTLSTGLMGLHGLAGYYRRLTIAAIEQAGAHQKVLSRALIGMYASQRADWDEALETISNVVKRFDEIGAFHSADESVGYLVRVHVHTGDLDHGLTLATNSYKRAKQRNDRIVRFHLFVMVVLLSIRKKQLSLEGFEDAALLSDLTTAETLFKEPFEANPLNRSFYHAARAFYHLSLGNHADAFASLQTSAWISQERKIERSVLYFELYATLAEISLYLLNSGTLNTQDQASTEVIFQNSVKKLAKYGKVFTLAQPRVALYQGWQQHTAGRAVQAHTFWKRSLASATRLKMPYDAGLAHAALARYTGYSEADRMHHSQEAGKLFRQVNAVYDAEILEGSKIQ